MLLLYLNPSQKAKTSARVLNADWLIKRKTVEMSKAVSRSSCAMMDSDIMRRKTVLIDCSSH